MATRKAAANTRARAEEIKRMAQEHGLDEDILFTTTYERYLVQIGILDDLRRTVDSEGTLVTKEYVKGRANVYTHPAIKEYNSTSTAANQTVQTLLKIIATKGTPTAREEADPFAEFAKAHA